jgi:hypothetical protein
LKQGPAEQSILRQHVRDGTPLPNAIANAPELEIGLHLYYVIFFELMSCRSLGQGSEGPIWWTAIDSFCNRNHIHGEQREDVFHHINELDKEYLKYRVKEIKKELAKGGKGKSKNGLTKRNDNG